MESSRFYELLRIGMLIFASVTTSREVQAIIMAALIPPADNLLMSARLTLVKSLNFLIPTIAWIAYYVLTINQ